jgi:hypothetical protein
MWVPEPPKLSGQLATRTIRMDWFSPGLVGKTAWK